LPAIRVSDQDVSVPDHICKIALQSVDRDSLAGPQVDDGPLAWPELDALGRRTGLRALGGLRDLDAAIHVFSHD
jgi:hypothetical protein